MQEAMKQGAILMDVRTPDEYKKHHLDGSINEPFFSLRMQLKTLDREKPFIVVCEDGRISEAAAFLLRRHKIDATILKGGIAGVISELENGDVETIADRFENFDRVDSVDHSASSAESTLQAVFFQHFEPSVDDCCRQIEVEFGFQLGKNREKMSKDQYLKLLEYLRSVRKEIKQNYLTKVSDIFNESYRKTANAPTEPLDFSGVSLMSGDAVEENHVITLIIRQCEHLFYEELTRLNRLFAIQSGKQAIADSQNPISPEKLIRALAEVVNLLKLKADSRIALYKTFEVNVFSQLGFVYRELLNTAKLPVGT
jgi:rhodanese-related sulfurtransferase